ncbi:helicase-exonuclease AddAB subunit AddA [Desulfotruncus alcoholivorax]|uniref:helicase-exonuclease AddAB subunit AddA n=1 Tax=Desulfotruncus alcoholivorax TaxID=265477 RepID=UPI0003FDCF49|nr:helicase-exonuclease AddAB subunit AddA [Desulfotruncus alcoholivorax]
MTSIRWTGEQRKAIETRNGNLLVSAAAGSGKTAVLVERIIQMLLDRKNPVDLDRLLVVTFTDAAAGEMRHRVGAALARALQEQPDSELLQRQLFLVPRANIGTLHSFCSEVIRSHFYLLKLDPGFRVMDENEASMLRSEIIEGMLENCYEEHRDAPPQSPFLQLARTMAGRHGDDRELVQLILRLYEFAHSMPRPAAWLNSVAAMLEQSGTRPWEEQTWIKDWRDMLRLEFENWRDDLEQALRLTAGPGGPSGYTDRLAGDAAGVRKLLQLVDGPFEDLKEALGQLINWPALPRVRQGESLGEIKKKVQELRDGVKKRSAAIYKDCFSRSTGDILGDLLRAAPLVRVLADLTLRFKKVYLNHKLDRAVVDFSDLEHFALAVLAQNAEASNWGVEPPGDPSAPLLPSSVALEYQEYFSEVLVDEYQDINGVQEAVLRLVSRRNNRFLVGDVKQSIYRFRLADPTVFLDYYRSFGDIDDQAAGGGEGLRLDLRSNFRSRPEILNTVNYLFGRLMNEQVAELAYDDRARLNPGAGRPVGDSENEGCGEDVGEEGGKEVEESPVEIHLLEHCGQQARVGGEDSEEESLAEAEALDELDLVRLEARWVAERVYRLVKEGETGGLRRVTWRDIVVLMRSPRGRAGIYLEEFRRYGIPAYADGGGGYFDAPEVQTVIALLQVIDNPARDIPLAAVLRSPIIGLDAARLAEIRVACPGGDFYSAVRQVASGAGESDRELMNVLSRFLERLDSWRDLASRTSPAELLEELYRQTGYCDLVGAMPGGVTRQANLRALVDRARRFEGTVYRGLFRFLRFVEQVRETGGDMDAARSLGENEDVVRLMSVHRSKGLEFPVVVVAGLGRGFNFSDLRQNPLLHRRLGCGPVIVDLERGIKYPTVLHRVIKQRVQLETLAEEMRLLYVALTRAREKLIITAAIKDLDKAVQEWTRRGSAAPAEGPLSAPLLAGAKTPVDWLGPALWSHATMKAINQKINRTISRAGEAAAAGTGDWRVFLWPSDTLKYLRETDQPGEEPESETWLGFLRRLEPLPEEWLRQQEETWPGGAKELLEAGELQNRLLWRYPHLELAGRPSKVTVTEWRHRQDEPEEGLAEAGPGMELPVPGRKTPDSGATGAAELPPGFNLPVFYTGSGFDGSERGRVVHLVMQNLSFDQPLDQTGIDKQLENMVDRKILGDEQRRLVPVEQIARFFKTPLGLRLVSAAWEGRLWRELPFTTGIEAAELYPDLAGKIPAGEIILLQGVIDCLLVEKDGLVIIDYKTDRLSEGQITEAAGRYRIQLELYARAAGSIAGVPVLEKYLHFFSINKAVLL